MTGSQVALILKLVERERSYWQSRVDGERYPNEESRMVEVNRHFGVDPRTARSLENAGLIEGWATDNNRWLIRLKTEDVGRPLIDVLA